MMRVVLVGGSDTAKKLATSLHDSGGINVVKSFDYVEDFHRYLTETYEGIVAFDKVIILQFALPSDKDKSRELIKKIQDDLYLEDAVDPYLYLLLKDEDIYLHYEANPDEFTYDKTLMLIFKRITVKEIYNSLIGKYDLRGLTPRDFPTISTDAKALMLQQELESVEEKAVTEEVTVTKPTLVTVEDSDQSGQDYEDEEVLDLPAKGKRGIFGLFGRKSNDDLVEDSDMETEDTTNDVVEDDFEENGNSPLDLSSVGMQLPKFNKFSFSRKKSEKDTKKSTKKAKNVPITNEIAPHSEETVVIEDEETNKVAEITLTPPDNHNDEPKVMDTVADSANLNTDSTKEIQPQVEITNEVTEIIKDMPKTVSEPTILTGLISEADAAPKSGTSLLTSVISRMKQKVNNDPANLHDGADLIPQQRRGDANLPPVVTGDLRIKRSTLVFTGDRRSGVTSSAANAAYLLSKIGTTVLLDLDFVRPSLWRYFPKVIESAEDVRNTYSTYAALMNPACYADVGFVINKNLLMLTITEPTRYFVDPDFPWSEKIGGKTREELRDRRYITGLLSYLRNEVDYVVVDMPFDLFQQFPDVALQADYNILCVNNTEEDLYNTLLVNMSAIYEQDETMFSSVISRFSILLTNYNTYARLKGKEITPQLVENFLQEQAGVWGKTRVIGFIPHVADFLLQQQTSKLLASTPFAQYYNGMLSQL